MPLSRAANRVGIAFAFCLVAAQAAAFQRADDRAWYQRFVGLSTTALIPKIRGQVGTTIRLGIVTTASAPRVVILTRR